MKKIVSLLTIIFLLLLISLAVLAFYFYFQYLALESNPAIATRYNSDKVEQSLSQFMVLPDEEPSISTVINKDELGDKSFFADAENGDMILIYQNARKAILWRPSTSKVIEVAPLIIKDANIEKQLDEAGYGNR